MNVVQRRDSAARSPSKAFARAAGRLASIAVLTAPLGCSFMFTEGPPPDHETRRYFDCSTSAASPLLDILWMIPWMAALADSNDGEIAMLGLTGVVLHGTSSVRGFMKVSACGSAKRSLEARLNAVDLERPSREAEVKPPLWTPRTLPPGSPLPSSTPPQGTDPITPYRPPEEEAAPPGSPSPPSP